MAAAPPLLLPRPGGVKLLLLALLAGCGGGVQVQREPSITPGGSSSSCVEAVLVEPRRLRAIAVALESAAHRREVPGGPPRIEVLTLAHGRGNADYVARLVNASDVLREAYDSGRLRLLLLDIDDLGEDAVQPPFKIGDGAAAAFRREAANASALLATGRSSPRWRDQYSRLLLDVRFWEQMRCDHVLTMQSDSILCLNSPVKLAEFLDYDFVGPVACGGDHSVTNGGLSLRSRAAMMSCARRVNLEDLHGDDRHEDQFFSLRCPDVVRKPPESVKDRFAIDNGFRFAEVTPYGMHKPWGVGDFHGQHEVQNMNSCVGSHLLQNRQRE